MCLVRASVCNLLTHLAIQNRFLVSLFFFIYLFIFFIIIIFTYKKKRYVRGKTVSPCEKGVGIYTCLENTSSWNLLTESAMLSHCTVALLLQVSNFIVLYCLLLCFERLTKTCREILGMRKLIFTAKLGCIGVSWM